MSAYIYFTVRFLAAGYLLYRLWIILFRHRLFGFWDQIFKVQEKTAAISETLAQMVISGEGVLGKTQIIYLEDPEVAATVPAHSEELPPSDFIGEEKDISSDDVEVVLTPGEARKILEDDEMYEPLDDGKGLDPDFSTALTYDQMTNIVNVLSAATDDEAKIIDAAQTLYTVRNADMFQFFTAQVSNTARVEDMFKDCLDGDGKPLLHRKSRNAPSVKFDWGKFV